MKQVGLEETKRRSPDQQPSVTFACCVESGILEPMTIRLVESLRRFGGRFSSCPVVAVTPRLGPPIARSTRDRLADLDVEYARLPFGNEFAWFHYLNKAIAVAHAEERADTELVAFVDSDVLVLDEPTAFDLAADVDFTAAVSDVTVGATSGRSDPADATWNELCRLVGIELDDLPWVTTHLDHKRIRLYLQAGIFEYRRALRFGTEYRDAVRDALRRRIRLPGNAWTFVDQALLAPFVVSKGLRWSELPFSHNHTMTSALSHYFDPETFREARVLHYHDSMLAHFWPTLLERLDDAHPDVAEWLRPLGPVVDSAAAHRRLFSEALRTQRGLRRRAHQFVGERAGGRYS
jgi:hypothetical protein